MLKSPEIIIFFSRVSSFFTDFKNFVNQFFLYVYFSVFIGLPFGT